MGTDKPKIAAGDVLTVERVFTLEDVRAFAVISEDTGTHHVVPDEQGRLLVHGLLVASLPTRIGGSLDYLAREMVFEFLRPVFTGDRIRCEVTVTEVNPGEGRLNVTLAIVCRNDRGKDVMRASSAGIIRS